VNQYFYYQWKQKEIVVFLIKLYWYINQVKKVLGLVSEREPYRLGHTPLDFDACYEALIPLGYQWDYFAWEDIGEGVSVRRLYDNRQVHIRVFALGEVRAHDELNYEFEPVKHYNSETLKIPSHDDIELVKKALNIEE